MPVILPSEQGGTKLDEAQGEALFANYRASQPITIASDAITLPGSGRYRLTPETGTSDQITSITLSAENVEGAVFQLRTSVPGDTITLVHGTNLRLPGGINAELSTVFSSIWIRHYGSGVFVADSPVIFVP